MTNEEIPTVDCTREGSQLVFRCTYCWTYGSAYGSSDIDQTHSYKRRPKRAKPVIHRHGNGEGHRVAHCYNVGSAYYVIGYYIREVESDTTDTGKLLQA